MGIFYTCGDPFSINIEAFLRTVAPFVANRQTLIGIGSHWQLQHQAEALAIPLPKYKVVSQLNEISDSGIFWYDPWPEAPQKDARQMSEQERGLLALKSLQAIPKSFKKNAAVLTAPIHKKAASLAGFAFPGQTEFFESLWGQDAVMMLAGPRLRVALATNHLPLNKVANVISKELIGTKLKIIHDSCQRLFGINSPKIGVCGLNPHAGDGGLFGSEDEQIIAPAIQAAIQSGLSVKGPLPADTAFYRGFHGEFDAILAMYHDQGLGPLKTVHFDEAVNISMGLPYLRVSPDHGPASDLYLTGRASVKSFELSIRLCEQWLNS